MNLWTLILGVFLICFLLFGKCTAWLLGSLSDSGDGLVWPALLVGGSLSFAGFVMRRQARRWLDRLDYVLSARRSLRDVAPGLACVSGRWRTLQDRRGVIEDDGGAALVVFAAGHAGAPPADGTEVIAYGLGGGLVDDPRGAGYRGDARLPQLAIVDAGHFVRPAAHSHERAAAIGQRWASVGALAFALGVGIMTTAAVIALRASSLFGFE